MNISLAEQQLTQQLSKVYEHAEAVAITNMVMQELTGHNKSDRRMASHIELTEDQQQQLEQMTAQLLRCCPVQYVIGKAWFHNMELLVNEDVLIPRPETEELVQWVLEEKQDRKKAAILDIGTGSGCIPIAVKKSWQEAIVTAIDVSNMAIVVAKENAKRQQTAITFLQVDILDWQKWHSEKFDIIVSNPPYIPKREGQLLDKNVADWEPHLALFVPNNDPLLFYKAIAAFAKRHLYPNGSLYFECHQQFAQQVVEMLEAEGFTSELREDIFGNERMVKGKIV